MEYVATKWKQGAGRRTGRCRDNGISPETNDQRRGTLLQRKHACTGVTRTARALTRLSPRFTPPDSPWEYFAEKEAEEAFGMVRRVVALRLAVSSRGSGGLGLESARKFRALRPRVPLPRTA